MSSVVSNALVGIVIGGLASAFGAFLGFLASNEPFIGRKFVTGILTGTVAGVLIGFGSAPVFAEIQSDLALLIVYGEIFGSALAATWGVPKVSGAVTSRVLELLGRGGTGTEPSPSVTPTPPT